MSVIYSLFCADNHLGLTQKAFHSLLQQIKESCFVVQWRIYWCSLLHREILQLTALKCLLRSLSFLKVTVGHLLSLCSDCHNPPPTLWALPFAFSHVSIYVISIVSHCLTDASTRGVAMIPKLALDVMSCEVMRVLQLTDSCIVPISYHVPRKVRKQHTALLTWLQTVYL